MLLAKEFRAKGIKSFEVLSGVIKDLGGRA